MLDTILSGLLLASVSALAVIAYRHHEGYLHIYRVLMPAAVVLFLGAEAWNVAVVIIVVKTAYVLGLPDYATLEAVMTQLEIPELPLALTGIFVFVYLIILKLLPDILQAKKS
jgi:hypothetical protein